MTDHPGLEGGAVAMVEGWKPGLPPGKFYEGMVDDFEVYFSPAGLKWHRKRTATELSRRAAEQTPASVPG